MATFFSLLSLSVKHIKKVKVTDHFLKLFDITFKNKHFIFDKEKKKNKKSNELQGI